MAEQDLSLTGASSRGEPGQDSNPQNIINIRPNGLVELTRIPQPGNNDLSRPVTIIGKKDDFLGPTQKLIEDHEERLRSAGTAGEPAPGTNRPNFPSELY